MRIYICYKVKLVLVLISISIYSCTDYLHNQEDLLSILGVPVTISEKIYAKEEWGGIHGDGFVINVYKLSDVSINFFLNNDSMQTFPLPNKNGELKVIKWQMTPIKNNYEEIRTITINYFSDNKNVNMYQNQLDSLLDIKGNYYAFYYNKTLDRPNKVYFYLINPSERLLYVINSKV